jgi:hypothetical protein
MVMLRFADDTTDEQKEAMRSGLRRLPELIPEIRAYRFGDDLGLRDDNFDFGLTADFDDKDSFLVYRDNPDHQKVIADLITPVIAARVAVQFKWPAALPPDLPG